jgi:hypothetical protein
MREERMQPAPQQKTLHRVTNPAYTSLRNTARASGLKKPHQTQGHLSTLKKKKTTLMALRTQVDTNTVIVEN